MFGMKSAVLACCFFLFSLPSFPADAPAETDQALRARVNEFYGFLVEHKSRAAEALVAEDTKDLYYDSQKPEVEKFQIEKIAWGPSFQTAEVIIEARVRVMFPGLGPQTVSSKVPSLWKLENGKWCWYIDKSRLADSPFGQFHSSGGGSGQLPAHPAITPEMLKAAVKPDRNQIAVDLTDGKTTIITLTNSLPGPVQIQAPKVTGMAIDVAKPSLASGESTKVSFKCENPDGPHPPVVNFTVLPTNQQIPIQLIFSVNNH
jgi:hypothetical protein